MTKTLKNGIVVDMTAEEQADYDDRIATETAKIPQYKLEKIRSIRDSKLTETDHLALSDNVLTDEIKAFRKSMRDIPQDYSADKYDELLARDDNGNLTHSVWSKP